VSKTFNKSILPLGTSTVKATVSVRNTGEAGFTDLVITDVMSNAAKMTILPGTSTLPGGDPIEGPPGTWTFPPQILLANATHDATLTFSYDIKITDLQAGEQICNQVTAAAGGLISDGPQCRVCNEVPPPPVPALGTIGFAVALAMVTMSGVFLYRQRRKRA